MMGLAAHAFHWPPQIFWDSTPHEFWAAYEIWEQANTVPEGD